MSILSYSEENYKKGEVLVKVKDREVITSIGENFGLLSSEKISDNLFLLKFTPDADIFEIITAYKDNENVIYAEPNYIRKIQKTDNRHSDNSLQTTDEPGILELQEAAIRYNNLSPSTIKLWQKEAKIKPLFPKFSIDYDKSITSYEKTGFITGPNEWRLTFSWDLGELIYNPDQTSIDERSRLMTRLRNEILSDVTKLYFERKRLILEGKEKNRIRIEELTGLIDGYTGGAFSKKIIDKR
ncbi:MAG: hypothetical protein AB1595_04370 [bacterium]